LVLPQETLPVDNGSEFFVFKVGYVDIPNFEQFQTCANALGFDSQPNLTRFFLTFHPKTRRSFTTLSLRCVSIASQLVAAKIVGTETGA